MIHKIQQEQSAASKPPSMPSLSPANSVESSRDLQCVRTMKIVATKPVELLCGSIRVRAATSFPTFNPVLLSSQETVIPPMYRMIPNATDLNRPPPDFPKKVLPLAAVKSRITEDISKDASVISTNLSKKCEDLAVSGLVDYGDEINVISPDDILKQIFKMPYSKARVSIVVQRIGQTLVLKPGPDVEEGEKLVRRHNNQPKCTKNVDKSLFLNFAMHSERMEACYIPPTHNLDTEKQSSSSALPAGENCPELQENVNSALENRLDNPAGSSKHFEQDGSNCEKKKKKTKECDPVRKNSHIGEKIKPSGDSEKQRRGGSNEFLRVLKCQFDKFRMLLGSDLLLFSNDKYVAVSLHLWDVSQQVTSLTWLEAWLDNVMASVPEIAICYHKDGVVEWYELLKTEDIFRLKGISEDGTPAFFPHFVLEDGLDVLRFLQSNCKEDPGAYWLHKRAGEEEIQLFDLSVISKNHSSRDHNASTSPQIHSWRRDSLFSLGNLLYRVGHRLSLSVVPNDRTKCSRFLIKCVNFFLYGLDHQVVRAYAHEQLARLILNNLVSEVEITDLKEESLDHVAAVDRSEEKFAEDNSTSRISSKLKAIHQISQAIKSLSWRRQQLQSSEQEDAFHGISSSVNFSTCACGDPDCIEVCDIWKWFSTSKVDRKMWNLVLLLGESWLSLGEAYKEVGLLHKALNAVELACSYYGSMPQKFEETLFVSSINNGLSPRSKSHATPQVGDLDAKFDISVGELSSTRLFWSKVWMLVGDIYFSFHCRKGQELSRISERTSTDQIKMPSELAKEVQRLKEKLTEDGQNCPSCSLVNCSCKSDRASSGSSSSNGSSNHAVPHSRNLNRKLESKNVPSRLPRVEEERVNVTAENMTYKEKDTSVGTKEVVALEQKELNAKGAQQAKEGGIFKYLKGVKTDDAESNLLAALYCYEETRKALQELPSGCDEYQSVIKKKGYLCNELGRIHLERNEFNKATDAFADAAAAFKEVSDLANVIKTKCNLGYGHRFLADKMAKEVRELLLSNSKNAYQEALGTAKLEFRKSLEYYIAAKTMLCDFTEEASSIQENAKLNVYTQLGNTYVLSGILLAGVEGTAKARGRESILENAPVSVAGGGWERKALSAIDAVREAIALYESCEKRQEVAYAYRLLAQFQKDRCLRFVKSESPESSPRVIMKAKHHVSLADGNWQKSLDFYRPKEYPSMYLKILIEKSAFSYELSFYVLSNTMLESALSCLLEGRHFSKTDEESLKTEDSKLYKEFWDQLQKVLKQMLNAAKMKPTEKSKKLKELYRISLESTSLGDLSAMHGLWTLSS